MMIKKYARKLLFLTLSIFSLYAFAQTKQEAEKIKKSYDLTKLKSLSKKYEADYLREKQKALVMAQQKGWRVKYTDSNGSLYELMAVTKDGFPLYYKTDNSDAALSTRTNYLHNGGGLGLNLEGQGMTAHVWDGGLARVTHQEYDGAGGDDRYSVGDETTALNFHGAHVTGTIIASGVDPEAKGMAPQAKGVGYYWDNDLSEMTTAAANGMLLSNHSYGFPLDQVPSWIAGAYISASRGVDEIMYNSPYYLMVTSAGNSGNDNVSNTSPLDGEANYDKLTGMSTSKNNLVVANAQDATINGDGSLSFVSINAGSSEGPTDDLRIKPDITGNGTSLHSTFDTADNSYNRLTGTSMSSPNVCGSLLLIQQHYNNLYGSFMLGATLKALALHTADDNGITGPDAIWGWGLLNAKKIAETITDRGLFAEIKELELADGGTYTFTVKADGTNPLIASINWTDVPGTINGGTANDATAILVNDLDLRVSNTSDTFLPWKLTGVNTNEKADNVVDPYERVDVGVGSGEYTITVTHKGTLTNGSQKFSLVVTGIVSDYTFSSTDTDVEACKSGTAQFDFDYRQSSPTTTNFTVENGPAGVTANFSSSTLTADGTFSVTFNNLQGLTPGTHTVDVVGDNGAVTKRQTVEIFILEEDFTNHPQTLSAPANALVGAATSGVTLEWVKNTNAQSYLVEVSTNPSFTTLFDTSTTANLSHYVTGLAEDTVYYWRIKPQNTCGTSNTYSEVRSFQTYVLECSNSYSATNFGNASVDGINANETGSVSIFIGDNLTIEKMTVDIGISHTSVSDLRVSIQEPSALGSNEMFLLTNDCDGSDDINATFDDEGADLSCSTSAPAISGTIKPSNLLSASRGKDPFGWWNIFMRDDVAGNGGNITSATINICTVRAANTVPNFTNNVLEALTNSSLLVTSAHMEATTNAETAAEQVYTLVVAPTKGNLTKSGATLNAGDTFTQEDINNGLISYENTQTALFTDEFKVDILNGVNGWLANQTISVTSTLSVDRFDIGNLAMYPNPSSTEINIRISSFSNDPVTVEIFDLQGRSVLRNKYKDISGAFSESVDVRSIASGIYLLKVKQGSKEGTRKIIISK